MVTLIAPRKTAATATTSGTLTRGSHTPVDATAAALTMTLPTNAPVGVEVSVEKVDASTNAVTISGTIRGTSSTLSLTNQYDARTFLSEGGGSWRPISDHRTQTSLDAVYARQDRTKHDLARGLYFPEAEGATGGSDDTAALLATFSKARAAKGTVDLGLLRTYITTAALDPGGTRVRGNMAQLKIKSGITPNFSVITPTSACVIEHLFIDCNKANTTDPGSQLQGCGVLMGQATWDGLVLRSVSVSNSHQIGVHIFSTNGGNDAATVTSNRTLLEAVTVDNTTVANYSIRNMAGVTLKDCWSTNGASLGFYLNVVGKSSLINCHSTGNAGGASLTYCQYVDIIGGEYSGNTGTGVTFGGGSTTTVENKFLKLIGATLRANGNFGFTCDPTKAGAPSTWVAGHHEIIGNVVEGNVGTGMNFENAGYHVVSGNTVRGNGAVGIRVLGAYTTLTGNNSSFNTGFGIVFFGVPGNDYGHHRVGSDNIVANNTAGQWNVNAVAAGDVTDVLSDTPLVLSSSTGGTGATKIGAVGPAAQAGVVMNDVSLYRSSAFLAVLSQAIRIDGAAIFLGSAADTAISRFTTKVAGVNSDNVWRIGHNVTASRPSATTAGAGGEFYDDTLKKPIWSDGTTWRDATGTAV